MHDYVNPIRAVCIISEGDHFYNLLVILHIISLKYSCTHSLYMNLERTFIRFLVKFNKNNVLFKRELFAIYYNRKIKSSLTIFKKITENYDFKTF